MTDTDRTPRPSALAPGATLAPGDPRLPLARAVATAGQVIAGVRPDQLGQPTPCSEWDVLALARHMVAILRRVAAIGRREHWSTAPDLALDVPEAALHRAWVKAAEAVHAAWSGPLDGPPYELPFAHLPGPAALAVYTAEFTVHAWDLAQATGQQPAWDGEVVEVALGVVTAGIPAEGRGPGMPFDPVVPTPPDAPAIDRLVAWVGRRP